MLTNLKVFQAGLIYSVFCRPMPYYPVLGLENGGIREVGGELGYFLCVFLFLYCMVFFLEVILQTKSKSNLKILIQYYYGLRNRRQLYRLWHMPTGMPC